MSSINASAITTTKISSPAVKATKDELTTQQTNLGKQLTAVKNQ